MAGFSVVIITKNEAANIQACLEPLLPLSDDVLVIDSGSTDGTRKIARNLGARVLETQWQGYAATKNWGNAQANYPWILSIDADEVLSEDLVQSLQNWQPQPETVFFLDRITNYCGTWVHHSGWYPDWKPRLFNRNEVHWRGEYVHETLTWPDSFQTEKLAGKLLHYSYRTQQDHWDRMERYAQLSAQELFSRGKKPTWVKRHLSPAFRFFRTWVIKQGWRDGRTGWTISRRNAYLVRRRYQLLQQLYREGHS
jgi:glycosyltransferase involved in cell wall biosynthesis